MQMLLLTAAALVAALHLPSRPDAGAPLRYTRRYRSHQHHIVAQAEQLAPAQTPVQEAQPTPRTDAPAAHPLSPRPFASALSAVEQPLAVSFGVAATWLLHNHAAPALTPVAACGIVGLLSGIALPLPLALAAYCGSFTGMATTAVLPSLASVAVASAATAALFRRISAVGWMAGRGGRLGFIAQLACTAVFVASGGLTSILRWIAAATAHSAATAAAAAAATGASVFSAAAYCSVQPAAVGVMVVGSIAGALFTRIWQGACEPTQRLSNIVTASSGAGLMSLLLLPASMRGPALAGAFVAMSSSQVLPDTKSLVAAAAACGLWQGAMAGVLNGGWGGKLGTTAMLGVLLVEKATAAVSHWRRSTAPA